MSETFETCGKEIKIERFCGIVVENPACPQNVEPVIYGRIYPALIHPQVAEVKICSGFEDYYRSHALYLGSCGMTLGEEPYLHYWMIDDDDEISLGCMAKDNLRGNIILSMCIYPLKNADYLTTLLFKTLINNLKDK